MRIPKLSMATTEATLIEWLVADGDTVTDGQPLYLVETEKIETEVPGGLAGVIHCTGEPGVVYPVGTEVATIDTDD